MSVKNRVYRNKGILGGSVVKNSPAMQEVQVWSLDQDNSLEKEMATHSRILAWETLLQRGLVDGIHNQLDTT